MPQAVLPPDLARPDLRLVLAPAVLALASARAVLRPASAAAVLPLVVEVSNAAPPPMATPTTITAIVTAIIITATIATATIAIGIITTDVMATEAMAMDIIVTAAGGGATFMESTSIAIPMALVTVITLTAIGGTNAF
ncbi:MAG TPA: hypothetical protein VMI72_10925 [Roseiarcus sp.]|nr:hypothetical protein [Roseiarcus sp.]